MLPDKSLIEQTLQRLLRFAQTRVWPALRRWLAPEQRRSYRAWIFQGYILVSLLAFIVLAVLASLISYFAFDVSITQEIQAELPDWTGQILLWISWPGYGLPSVLVTTAIVLILVSFGLRWEGLMAASTSLGAWLLNNLLKFAIRRPRPTADLVEVFQELTSYSFPSGHVMFYSAFFGFLAFLSFTLVKRGWLRAVLVALFISLVSLVGLSRVYLGEHWASDVIGAYLIGFLVLIAAIRIYRWGQERRLTNTDEEP